jgi:hypothetical protein
LRCGARASELKCQRFQRAECATAAKILLRGCDKAEVQNDDAIGPAARVL